MNPPRQEHALLSLLCETPMHPGCGSDAGSVDLPVDRERHTGWPVLRGSAIKGVLRDAARLRVGGDPAQADQDGGVTLLFGQPTAAEVDAAGSVGVADARLVLLPVRSLAGTYALVTCRAALSYVARASELAWGRPCLDWASVPSVASDGCLVTEASELVPPGETSVLIEEYRRDVKGRVPAAVVASLAGLVPHATHRVRSALLVVHDDFFGVLARTALEVVTRNALDLTTRTVRDGALFSQELLPSETLLVGIVAADFARQRGAAAPASEVMRRFAEVVHNRAPGAEVGVHQFGGDATTGHGIAWCRLFRSAPAL